MQSFLVDLEKKIVKQSSWQIRYSQNCEPAMKVKRDKAGRTFWVGESQPCIWELGPPSRDPLILLGLASGSLSSSGGLTTDCPPWDICSQVWGQAGNQQLYCPRGAPSQ